MKIAYLILAHRNPKHIKRMIEALSCQDCAFFLHIDGKSNIEDFRGLKGDNVFFPPERVPVYWAEYSMVEAILILIRQALAGPVPYDYLVLLSGSDYPLRSKKYIHEFFEQRNGTQFISMSKIPDAAAGLPLSKINALSIPSSKPVYRFVMKGLARLNLAKRDFRKHLGALRPWGGSTWWALTRDACLYICEFVKENPSVCKYFERTLTSDETFFHTILGNSIFGQKVQRSLMYDDWSAGSPHPATIDGSHLALFAAQEKVTLDDAFGPGELLFARKFSDDSQELVRRIDELREWKDRKAG